MLDLLIRHAKRMDGSVADIGVAGTHISQIAPHIEDTAQVTVNASQCLTLPAFVNGQLHACKSFWRRILTTLSPEIQQRPRFEAAHHVKARYATEGVFTRVDETMKLAIRHGTCAIRLFADVDADAGLLALDALLRIREKYSPIMHVQVVAFPQDGFAAPDSLPLMRAALERGADIVGGIPWIEPGTVLQEQHTVACFELARASDHDLHFVCDDVADPASRSLEMVAHQTIAHDYQGRVSATQCAALSFYAEEEAKRVIALVKEAGITIFCNSHVSLIATDIDQNRHPWPRSITRVRDLLDAGVTVVCAQDDIDNWFYPFGRNDMLEVAQFMAHNGQFAWQGEVDRVLPMVTTAPAQVLSVENYGLHEGAEANLIVLDAPDWHQAIQFQAEKRFVILRGRLVAQSSRDTDLFLDL